MQMPEDKETMKSFLGMLNFLAKFYSRLSELPIPLKMISIVRDPYQATPQTVQCFQVIKMILGKDIKLPYFSTQKYTALQIDASIKGLGVALIKDGVSLYFASRTLSPAEKIYQILECETLASIWGMKHFNHILFSETFTLET